jgi:hypothetical protein
MPLSTEAVDAEAPLDPADMDWTCSRCGETKPLGEFTLQSAKRGRSPGWCKACNARYKRARYARKRASDVAGLRRQITLDAPISKCEALVAHVSRRLGGVHVLADYLVEHLTDPRDRRERLATTKLLMKLVDVAIKQQAARQARTGEST